MDDYVERFEAQYLKAMKCFKKEKETLLKTFYDFPEEHWMNLRISNSIESVFATLRLRTIKSKNCGSRTMTWAMILKLMKTAQACWQRLRG